VFLIKEVADSLSLEELNQKLTSALEVINKVKIKPVDAPDNYPPCSSKEVDKKICKFCKK
ncbi:hypothetical protein Mgra_00005553, partial [Meloidogyne graminicola]